MERGYCFRLRRTDRRSGVDADNAPACFEVLGEVFGDKATRLLDFVHDVCLFHHVPLAVGYGFLELIRQQLPTDIDAEHRLSQLINRECNQYTV